ncbi:MULTISPECIES: HPF/RaiA family ribosome-associated protein [Luteimonas]|jgi:ribosome-associated translation inhibitor RaiA|uniref:HPF/RaiA family ribosome-associated protein n=1 Tax=Luteimonas wenzhouensis TaxID=2599615 RepID=A0A5C5TV76_9GAMM|nr:MULTISPECIES: HPF/RaiA family ribosome-associated protein [Luteimonas]NLW97478.1 HPF/RaiA family ribosome-associated protein [Xanthomonadaceae bacterium]TWG93156.1 sigma 54 modulation/S30EA-like ribosomal protein [Luteimonas sp. J16]TWT17145.1 HPF/RaiA family ribosome-associated protein [Luteimonas wenzhouensis]
MPIIQLNTDNHIDGTDALEERVNAMLEQQLGRYFPRLSRIEVFLSDTNSPVKSGVADKRCALEARLKNDDPVGTSHDADTMEQAIRGACDKLRTVLDTRIGKQRGY